MFLIISQILYSLQKFFHMQLTIFKSSIYKTTIFPGNEMVSFLKVKKNIIKTISSLCWVSHFITWVFHFLSISLYVLCFTFDFWTIIFLMVLEIWNMVENLILLTFIQTYFTLKIWKISSRFFRVFFQLLNSKLWVLECMVLNYWVCCSIPSIELV